MTTYSKVPPGDLLCAAFRAGNQQAVNATNINSTAMTKKVNRVSSAHLVKLLGHLALPGAAREVLTGQQALQRLITQGVNTQSQQYRLDSLQDHQPQSV